MEIHIGQMQYSAHYINFTDNICVIYSIIFLVSMLRLASGSEGLH